MELLFAGLGFPLLKLKEDLDFPKLATAPSSLQRCDDCDVQHDCESVHLIGDGFLLASDDSREQDGPNGYENAHLEFGLKFPSGYDRHVDELLLLNGGCDHDALN